MANKPLQTLKKTSDFSRIKKSGRRLFLQNWMILNFAPNDGTSNRFGWTISRKVGSAVQRNKLKRWCREYFRKVKHEFSKTYDMNVIFREMNDKDFYKGLKFEEFKVTLDSGLRKIK